MKGKSNNRLKALEDRIKTLSAKKQRERNQSLGQYDEASFRKAGVDQHGTYYLGINNEGCIVHMAPLPIEQLDGEVCPLCKFVEEDCQFEKEPVLCMRFQPNIDWYIERYGPGCEPSAHLTIINQLAKVPGMLVYPPYNEFIDFLERFEEEENRHVK